MEFQTSWHDQGYTSFGYALVGAGTATSVTVAPTKALADFIFDTAKIDAATFWNGWTWNYVQCECVHPGP